MGAGATAAYDAHADWYDQFTSPAAGDYIQRVVRTAEAGPGGVPDLFGFLAVGD